MKVLRAFLGLLVFAVVIVLVLASTKPNSYSVERSADIAAPVATIQPLVDDFHNWKQWSPWEHLDPNMQETYSGAASGVGAVYNWQGNSKAGQGHMEILADSSAATKIDLQFVKPFKSENTTTFRYTPTTTGTHVVWTMSGPMPFMSKIMCVFTSMDKMIGPDFERGLASMKTIAERR